VDTRPDLRPLDIAATLATGRAALDHRAVVLGTGRPELRAGLDALAQDAHAPDVVRGTPDGGRLAVLFSGQGSQRAGMGRDLYRAHPAFADAFDEACAHFDPLLDRPLREVVFGDDQGVLDRTEYAQPALFAVEVALYRLWESWGLRPDALAGHSIGELAAAHVAGVFSLADACAIVAARGALMQALPEGGVMVAVRATEEEIAPECSDNVGIAAINGPDSLVLSGSELEVLGLADRLKAQGRKVTALRVSHAFHSPLMEPMLDAFRRVVAGATAHPPTLPIVSTLTGAPVGAEELMSPDHWVQHVRRPVRFADGVTSLAAQGVTTMVEVGPGSALTTMGPDNAPDAVFVPTLRADRPEPHAALLAAARLHVRGAHLDLAAVLGGHGTRVDLPTYAFQHDRYWLTAAVAPAGDGATAALGLTTGDHPLLRAAVPLPDAEGVVLTGRLSTRAQPWLADHGVGDRVLFPGTGFLDLALHAAGHCGLDTVEELTLHAPLVLPERGGRALRVTVGAESDDRRSIRVHSRAEDADRDAPWTEHATGTLTAGDAPATELSAWPPRDAAPMDVDDVYDRLTELGYDYGPVFRALRAAWRLGSDVYVEVSLPEGTGGEGFGVHPALLDAALHAPVLRALEETGGGPRLPFSFSGVRLHAAGASTLRVRWSPTGPDQMSLAVADPAGRPVASVESLVMRPVELHRTAPPATDALFRLEWTGLDLAAEGTAATGLAVLDAGRTGADDLGLGVPAVPGFDALDGVSDLLAPCPRPSATEPYVPDEKAAVRAAVSWALTLAQDWLADERTAGTRLVFVTRGAVHTPAPDPAQAAVWGFVRSAQTENPGRFVLLDLDDTEESARAVPAALACGEPQSAVRGGLLTVPRLTRASADGPRTAPAGHQAPDASAPFDPDRPVLVTGGLGTLGALVARHLVTDRGVRRLVLAGRNGLATEGAPELRDDLTASGAEVTVAECDVADRDAVAALLASLDRPLGAVVHAAGVVDDGVVESLTPERVDRVLGPKVDGLLHLDELTRDSGLSAFVVFSSAAGVLGSAGQAGYAAANAALDALVRRRHALGLPGTSLAWGMWAAASGMTAGLDADDRARLGRSGVLELPTPDALALFDAATRDDHAVLVPVRLDTATLRGLAADGTLPPVLRGLVRAPVRRAATAAPAEGPTFTDTLAGQSPADREQTVLDLVRAQVAAVLGHTAGTQIDPGRSLQDLGFDSLTSVELRNRLTAATGIRLPSTLVFDHPSAAAITRHVLTLLPRTGTEPGAGVLDQLDRLESALFALADDGTATKVDLRLRALLAKWTDTRADAADEDPGSDDLSAATDDELFDYLDNELETS
jgi:acyl transferase domain-containing protein/acyl carrier protein